MKSGTPGRKALIVVDMLNDFVRPGAPMELPDARSIVPALRRRIAKARRDGELVIYVCDSRRKNDPAFARMGWPPHAVEGTAGAAVIPALSPAPGDVVVEKRSHSGFHRTALETVLRRHAIWAVTLAGCPTNVGVLYTAACASSRGYDVTVDERHVAGPSRRDHAFALDQMEKALGVRVIRCPAKPAR